VADPEESYGDLGGAEEKVSDDQDDRSSQNLVGDAGGSLRSPPMRVVRPSIVSASARIAGNEEFVSFGCERILGSEVSGDESSHEPTTTASNLSVTVAAAVPMAEVFIESSGPRTRARATTATTTFLFASSSLHAQEATTHSSVVRRAVTTAELAATSFGSPLLSTFVRAAESLPGGVVHLSSKKRGRE
jgi:hypothetical protein